MTILNMWGFDDYATLTHMYRELYIKNENSFGSINYADIVAGRFTGNCLRAVPSATRTSINEFQFTSASNTYWFSFACKTNSWILSSGLIVIAYNEAEHMEIRTNRDRRQLEIYRVGALQDRVNFQHNVWHHMEIKLIVDNSVGEITIKLDGVQIFSQTGVDTLSGSTALANQFSWRANDPLGNSGIQARLDDLIINDDQGTVNNTWMGDTRIQTLVPTADTATADFTPLAGSNFSNVDDGATGPDDDTSYVESNTPAHQDLYDMGSLDATATTVAALNVHCMARKSDVGSRSIRLLAFEGVTLGTGAIKPISYPSYTYNNELFELNPDTSALWTVTEINAAQIGMENV